MHMKIILSVQESFDLLNVPQCVAEFCNRDWGLGSPPTPFLIFWIKDGNFIKHKGKR